MADELLSPEELAAELKVSVRTVYNWRTRKIGPPGFKVGRRVRYRRADVDAWLEQQQASEDRR